MSASLQSGTFLADWQICCTKPVLNIHLQPRGMNSTRFTKKICIVMFVYAWLNFFATEGASSLDFEIVLLDHLPQTVGHSAVRVVILVENS